MLIIEFRSSVLASKEVATDERCAFYMATSDHVTSDTIFWSPIDYSTSTDLFHLRSFISSFCKNASGTFRFRPSSTDLSIPSFLAVFRPQRRLSPSRPFTFSAPVSSGTRVYIEGAPFAIESPALFLGFQMRGSISFIDDTTGVILSDARYLDGMEGSAVVIDDDNQVSVGIVAGALQKVNGEGEVLVIYPWSSIVDAISQQLYIPPHSLSDLNESMINIKDASGFKPIVSKLFVMDIAPKLTTDTGLMKQTVVCIYVYAANGRTRSWGSGILLSPSTIVTNHHVVPSVTETSRVVVVTADKEFLRVRETRMPFEGLDMIFLLLDKPMSMNLAATLTTENNIQRGEPVISVGYGLFSAVATRTGAPLLSRGFISSIVNLPLTAYSGVENSMLAVSACCWNGSSGGGIYSCSTGHLLGMITSNAKTEHKKIYPQLGFIIPVSLIKLGFDSIANTSQVFDKIELEPRVKRIWKMQPTHSAVLLKTKL